MVRRKDRVAVVLDTDVLIAFYLSTNPASANAKVYRLWRDRRRLQLVLSMKEFKFKIITPAEFLREVAG
ncbi:MAG TPA: hypothetical protein VG148_02065 [Pyrinomonadaceae bacterium]|nr:hypothetical protein [Pyrinomonadaceae bacterium]